ncbi:MAG: DNA repair protein RecN [Alphaproteobacteria bacterium]|nr:DNA repair protein RecN [Alphaproteobacteria bacterium]
MLTNLTIRDFVLIEQLNLSFGAGLSVLTGETGAGKSILLDALSLALGGRADSTQVRKGAAQSVITATFSMQKEAKALLQEQGLDETEENIILRRVMMKDGGTKAFVNDQPVSVGFMRTLGDYLIEIHGQFETASLLNAGTHRLLLDQYAGIEADVSALGTLWESWRSAAEKLQEAQEAAKTIAQEQEFLSFAVEELEKLSYEADEEQRILEKRERLKHRGALLEAIEAARGSLNGDGAADSNIYQALRTLQRQEAKMGEAGAQIITQLDNAADIVQSAIQALDRLGDSLNEGGESLEAIEDRLYAVRGAARKYQCQVEELPQTLVVFSDKLKLATNQDDILRKLQKSVTEAEAVYIKKADEISAERKKSALSLAKKVQVELPPLKLEKAQFEVSVAPLPAGQYNASGIDDVKFLVSTNPGQPAGALNKIASGGEMARFLLALKAVLAKTGTAQTLIFDEIDTGIGGATADAVGERLARLAADHSVLVVTHSPQVASKAQAHFIVSKASGTTAVTKLETGEARREEIARMLSGAEITAEARAAADKLLKAA